MRKTSLQLRHYKQIRHLFFYQPLQLLHNLLYKLLHLQMQSLN